jgi:hypothetical protein
LKLRFPTKIFFTGPPLSVIANWVEYSVFSRYFYQGRKCAGSIANP